ncbi:MAG TPA: SLC13 family permease [Phototrophicaceae bacterium]|nr:SLC13 family permease [Phototrophicaceae bacterium]
MTLQIGILLLIIAAALVLFAFEWVSADVVALGVLITLTLTGLLPTEAAFAGFGSNAVIMILGLLILTAALTRTGVVDMAGRAIIRQAGDDPNKLLVIIIVASAVVGAFMSNTASTAFFVPVVIGLANRLRVSASKLLMPLAFASILTSSVTLISTSTNIIVSDLMTRADQAPMGMFELAPVGIPITLVGLAYLLTIGRRLIPDRISAADNGDQFGMREYLTEVVVLPESPLVGKTLAESALGKELDLSVIRIRREKKRYLTPGAGTVLQAEDELMVEGQREEILKIKDTVGVDIKADFKLADPEVPEDEIRLIEGLILPRSPLIGRTLKGFRFRERFGVQVLGIYRRGETVRRKISQVRLQIGDILLLQGSHERIVALDDGQTMSMVNAVTEARPNYQRAPLAAAIFIGSLLIATFNLVSLPVAVLIGALLVFVTRCITPEEAYRDLEWKAIILIGSMLALGAAMEATGAAEFLAQQLVNIAGQANPLWLLAAFFGLTVVLTQPMSNQAAAIVVVPIALQTATQLGLNPRAFAMMIAVAASCSYLTPLEPACLMVYGPGNYRFIDFMKVGSLLTVFIFVIAILLVPLIWPL